MIEPDRWDSVLSRARGTIYRNTERIRSNALLNLLEVGPDPVTRRRIGKGANNGGPPDRGVVPMFCRKPGLGKDPLTWSRPGGKAARWRSRRLRQLGKSSQPIETKWADLAPVGKIVA